jgi:hypothetical protein
MFNALKGRIYIFTLYYLLQLRPQGAETESLQISETLH